jgi:predicted transcriptional regulator
VFVRQCLYLLSVRTQLVEHCTLSSNLLHVSAVFGHHQVDFTVTCMEKNTDVDMKETPPPGYSFPFILLL